MKALIAGGGIGGLTAALCLHRAGIDCEVFEAATEIKPLGVGINLLPHAVRVLTVLGLDPALAATAIATADLTYYSKSGQEIWSEPRGIAAGYRWPQYSIHRGELQMILLAAVKERLGPHSLGTGLQLTSFTDHGSHVEATLHDRTMGNETTRCGDVLIGADGIHSRVRSGFYLGEHEPRFSGRLLWRSTTEAQPFLTGRSMIMAGHERQKFVAYPISGTAAREGRSLINWVAELTIGGEREPPRDWDREVTQDRFAAEFADWRFTWLDIPGLIANSNAVYEFPMSDREPVERWSFGRVTLLGDAAHPMYPIGSNGASQAILDAAALAVALSDQSELADGLRHYEARRLGATSKIVLSNRQQGPEAVMQMVEERAPNGFTRLEDVISRPELEEVAARYKKVAGLDRESLNAMDDNVLA